MTRRRSFLSASVVLLVVTLSAPPARALDEPERLRLVGERAFADGLYGLAWSDLELHRPEVAIVEFRELLDRWPDYALVPSAKLHLARTLVEQKRFGDALPLLESFATKYPNHKQLPDAQYLLGLARVKSGDAKAGLADLRAFVAAAPNHELVPAARRLIMETITRQGDRGAPAGRPVRDQARPLRRRRQDVRGGLRREEHRGRDPLSGARRSRACAGAAQGLARCSHRVRVGRSR